MRSEEINVSAPETLSAQARLHYEIRDHFNQIAGEYDHKANDIAGQLDPGQAAKYHQWWQTLKPWLLKQAQLHDQFGKRFDAARSAYEAANEQNTKMFSSNGQS